MENQKEGSKGMPAAEYEIERLQKLVQKYQHALEESLKLQKHYAQLLNEYDGGGRIWFNNVDEWMARLDNINHKK